MFKPARMTRVLLGGHRDRMQDAIDVLHQQKLVHLEDFQDPTQSTRLGRPMEAGDELSDLLVHVRGLQKAIGAEGMKARHMVVQDPAGALAAAQAALSQSVSKVEAARARNSELEANVSALAPYAELDIDLGVARSVWSVKTLIGRVREPPTISTSHELTQSGNAIAVTFASDRVDIVEKELAAVGFQPAQLPDVDGTPKQALAVAVESHQQALAALTAAEAELGQLAEQWGERLASLERFLSAEVEKTQAPLQFAMTDATFNIEGWVPAKAVEKLQAKLAERLGDNIYLEVLGDGAAHDAAHEHGHDDHHSSPEDEAPVKLDNKGIAKPYEFMLGLLGRPRYWELDPTKLMLIFFPLFFGLMVGDVLVGLAIMGMGLYLKKNHIFGIGGPAVGRALFAGGLIAVIVGGFIFGEALGIHFVVSEEALEDGEHSWEEIFYGKEAVLAGGGFPTEGFLHKHVAHHGSHGTDGHGADNHTTDHGSSEDQAHGAPNMTAPAQFELMAGGGEEQEGGLTALFKPHGEVHLKAGQVQLGFYSKIHDIQALLAWCIVIAFVHLNLAFMLGIRNVAVGHGVTLAIQEKLSWITLQIGGGIAIWGALGGGAWQLPVGIAVVVASIGLLWVGVQKALGAPGFVAILEVLGFTGNILSYTRLAAIGASKAGMALAFAAIGFDVIGGGSVHSIGGWIVYLVGMVLITALAMLSGGLQSLRLQFVEFFGKFYEGGGRAYKPFGRR